jgi:hypothetical protein
MPANFGPNEQYVIPIPPPKPPPPPGQLPLTPFDTMSAESDSKHSAHNVAPSHLLVELMSQADVIRGLMRCLNDRNIPLRHVALAAGIHYTTIYQVIRSGKASQQIRAALTPVLQAINDGTLTFRRLRVAQTDQDAKYEFRDPRAWQDKAIPAEDFNYGRCRSCHRYHYTLVIMGNCPWYLCDQCRPWQTDGTGAQPLKAANPLTTEQDIYQAVLEACHMIGVKALARQASVSRSAIDYILRGRRNRARKPGRVSPQMRAALSPVLASILKETA